jgi:hypothetical protein
VHRFDWRVAPTAATPVHTGSGTQPRLGDERCAPRLAQFEVSLIHSRIVFAKAVFGQDPPAIGNQEGKKSRNLRERPFLGARLQFTQVSQTRYSNL